MMPDFSAIVKIGIWPAIGLIIGIVLVTLIGPQTNAGVVVLMTLSLLCFVVVGGIVGYITRKASDGN